MSDLVPAGSPPEAAGEWLSEDEPSYTSELADLRRRIEVLESGGGSTSGLKMVILTDPMARAYYELGRRDNGLPLTALPPIDGELSLPR